MHRHLRSGLPIFFIAGCLLLATYLPISAQPGSAGEASATTPAVYPVRETTRPINPAMATSIASMAPGCLRVSDAGHRVCCRRSSPTARSSCKTVADASIPTAPSTRSATPTASRKRRSDACRATPVPERSSARMAAGAPGQRSGNRPRVEQWRATTSYLTKKRAPSWPRRRERSHRLRRHKPRERST